MAEEELEHVQRWTAKRRLALVLSILESGSQRQGSSPKAWADPGGGGVLEGESPGRDGEPAPISAERNDVELDFIDRGKPV